MPDDFEEAVYSVLDFAGGGIDERNFVDGALAINKGTDEGPVRVRRVVAGVGVEGLVFASGLGLLRGLSGGLGLLRGVEWRVGIVWRWGRIADGRGGKPYIYGENLDYDF
jgi:hypothetical protein